MPGGVFQIPLMGSAQQSKNLMLIGSRGRGFKTVDSKQQGRNTNKTRATTSNPGKYLRPHCGCVSDSFQVRRGHGGCSVTVALGSRGPQRMVQFLPPPNPPPSPSRHLMARCRAVVSVTVVRFNPRRCFLGSVAQGLGHPAVNRKIDGSSPSGTLWQADCVWLVLTATPCMEI